MQSIILKELRTVNPGVLYHYHSHYGTRDFPKLVVYLGIKIYIPHKLSFGVEHFMFYDIMTCQRFHLTISCFTYKVIEKIV